MSGLREHKKAETRQAIMAAAVRLFAEKGYEKTSIEDLANAAGIGKATVYGYFATKDDIFMAYCDEQLEEAFAQLQHPGCCGGKLIDQLLTFFMIKFKFVTENKEFGRQMIREMVFPKDINEKSKEHDQRYFDILDSLFRSAQQRGEIGVDHDLFLLSVHFFSLYLGALAGWYTGYVSSTEEVEEVLKALFIQAFEGIAL